MANSRIRIAKVQMRPLPAGLLTVLALLLSACEVTGARPVPDMTVLDNMQNTLSQAERSHEPADVPPPEVLRELTPGLSLDDEVFTPVQERFNIVAEREPAGAFFRNLVAGTQYGVLVSPQVSGEISIVLPGVTIEEVMAAVQEAYGFQITRSGNIYQVRPAGMQTRTFTIDYLNIQRSGSSGVQVSSGNSTSGGGGGLGGLSGNPFSGLLGGDSGFNGSGFGGSAFGGGGIGGGIGGAGGGRGASGGQVNTMTQTDFWGGLQATLESLIGGAQGGRSVVVDRQVGLVSITANPTELDNVAAYIELVQGILSREVTIQVQFLEVILNKGFQSAIDFDTFGPGGENNPNRISTVFSSGGDTTIPGNSNPLAIVTNFTDFSAVFQILESRGTTQVLSSPSLKVLNNQKAVFQDGDEEYFQTSVGSSVITTGNSVSETSGNNLRPFFSGISMDITPQISADGSITLHVHPTITSVTEQTKPIAGEQVPTPRTSVRELDSIIRAEDGKIVVLGGLAYERSIDEAAGIPLAHDIPVIGAAFDQRRRTTVKSEFIILLRPVVATPQSEQRLIRERQERLQQINRDLDPFSRAGR